MLKKKFQIYDPKLKEECAVFGISDNSDASTLTALGLHALQHRGQEGCGIVSFDGKKYHSEKRFGLVGDNFSKEKVIKTLPGKFAIGHNRYSTTGGTTLRNIQPFFADTNTGGIGVSHNGNLTNAITLRRKLVEDGAIFYTTSDTETIVQLIARSKRLKTLDKIVDALFQIQGGYSLVMLTQNTLIGVRDPFGIRPLVIGKRISSENKNEWMVASESLVLENNDYQIVRDVKPGEAIYITINGEFFSQQCSDNPKLFPCAFEYVYLARPDSIMNGISVYKARLRMGDFLAETIKRSLKDGQIDVVMPIPDSSRPAAMQVARQLGIEYREGFFKNRYVGRTFIMPGQQKRKQSVRQKLNAMSAEFKNKNVLIVDDSIVRGTTSKQIVQMAKFAGANKVFFTSAAPPVRFPHVYGINMPSRNELIAHNRSIKDIAAKLEIDSLVYQSVEDLRKSIIADTTITDLEMCCFTGSYVTGTVNDEYLSWIEKEYAS